MAPKKQMNNTHLPLVQDYQAIIVNDRAKTMRDCRGKS